LVNNEDEISNEISEWIRIEIG